MLFPLPPSADLLRQQKLHLAQESKTQIQETVAIENEARGKTLEILQHYHTNKSELEALLRLKNDEKERKSDPAIRTNPVYACGDDVIYWNYLIRPEATVR